MCFSASASFTAGAVLTVIGVISVKKAKASSQVSFAAIPLIFAVQQISEGFLWIALSNPGYAGMQQFSMYTFLFFAQVVWPFWVPFAIMRFETNHQRRKFAMVPTVVGAIVSIYLAYCLSVYHVDASIVGNHIFYFQDYPSGVGSFFTIFYMIATITPPFFSSSGFMWLLGLAILISYAITAIFYEEHVISVWCFFASVISLAVLLIVTAKAKTASSS